MQGVRSLLEDRWDRCPFSLHGDLCMVGKTPIAFLSKWEVLLPLKKIAPWHLYPTLFSKVQKLIPKSGANNMKVVRLRGSHYCWIWDGHAAHSGPLPANQHMVPTTLCSHPGHIWLVQHKVGTKGRSATGDFRSPLHSNGHSKEPQ